MARNVLDEAYECPHCEAYAQQYWYRIIGYPHQQSNNHGTGGQKPLGDTVFAHCQKCGGIAIWIGENMNFPVASDAPLPNPDMPAEIMADFEEARQISSLSPRGAAALLRLCVQKLCIHLGEKGKDINDAIASLVAKGLSPLIQKSLDAVRVIGNEVVHPGTIDLRDDQDTATGLFQLLNLIVEQMISQPKHVQSMYDKLPLGKRTAIEKRDGKKS
jgi:hypothetical protein